APSLEIVGEEGALVCETPMFDDFGVIRYRSTTSADWSPLPPVPPSARWRRGMGVVEMVDSRASGSVPRLDKALALHVLEVIDAASRSGITGRRVPIGTSCGRPAPLPLHRG